MEVVPLELVNSHLGYRLTNDLSDKAGSGEREGWRLPDLLTKAADDGGAAV